MAAAYVGEIFRSGIQSVEPGQLEASRALGFSYPSSLVYFLGLVANQRELFQVGRNHNAQTGNLSPLVAAGLFDLALTVPLTHLVN